MQLPVAARRQQCEAGESAFVCTIRRLEPPPIITVVRSIKPNVLRAAALARWQGVILHLPYPGAGATTGKLF